MNGKMRIVKRHIWLLVAIASAYRVGSAQGQPPTATPVTIQANSHRPLADALDQLQQAVFSPINFEEAPYESSKDLGTQPFQAVSGPISFAFPLGGKFAVTVSQGDTDSFSTAQTVVNAYNGAKLSGVYRAVKKGNRVDVVPVQVLAADGISWLTVAAVMDRPVSFPSGSRSVEDAAQLLADTLSAAAGVKVVLATMPKFRGVTVSIGANNEPASDVLFAVFAQVTPAPLYYRLLYDPSGKTYYLTVRGAPANLGGPGPSVTQQKRTPRQSSPDSPFFKKSN